MANTGGWSELAARREVCARCGTRLDAPAAQPFAAIWKQDDGLRREDLCAACFDALPERPYYHWRCAPRQASERTRRERDVAAIEGLFARLGEAEGEDDEGPRSRDGLRYLLALELVRRRRLELVDLAREGGADCIVVRAGGDAELLTIAAPPLGEEELRRLGHELGAELGLGGAPPQEAQG